MSRWPKSWQNGWFWQVAAYAIELNHSIGIFVLDVYSKFEVILSLRSGDIHRYVPKNGETKPILYDDNFVGDGTCGNQGRESGSTQRWDSNELRFKWIRYISTLGQEFKCQKENAILSLEWAKFQTWCIREWNGAFFSRRHSLHDKPIWRARVSILREIIDVEVAKNYLEVQVWCTITSVLSRIFAFEMACLKAVVQRFPAVYSICVGLARRLRYRRRLSDLPPYDEWTYSMLSRIL